MDKLLHEFQGFVGSFSHKLILEIVPGRLAKLNHDRMKEEHSKNVVFFHHGVG